MLTLLQTRQPNPYTDRIPWLPNVNVIQTTQSEYCSILFIYVTVLHPRSICSVPVLGVHMNVRVGGGVSMHECVCLSVSLCVIDVCMCVSMFAAYVTSALS